MGGLGRRLAGLAAGAVLALTATACTGSGSTVNPASNAAGRSHPSASPTPQYVTITPASGTRDADPSAGITVTTARGTLTDVTVRGSGGSGGEVTGSYSADKTSWHSTWALGVSRSVTVSAAASVDGRTVTRTSSFRTRTPAATFSTEILEGSGQSYGVGMPILLYFSHRITNRAAVERALRVTTSTPVIGSWYWDDSCGTAPTCAYFRPRDYWPSGTTVSFTGHLNGVEGAPGVYGN
ncbi:MAG: hypothetical protein J2P26_11695, partial [Nocardiopsaceae bacterium]|nr:hypothetical protein [Nocardiopsaceae bacterium]